MSRDPRRPILLHMGPSSRLSSVSARTRVSRGSSMMIPSPPFRSSSEAPFLSVVITGHPQARASSTTKEQ